MGCHIVTEQAFEEFKREARELRASVVDSDRRLRKVERERDVLRREVGILHSRLKSPWGRLVSWWKIRRLNARLDCAERGIPPEPRPRPPTPPDHGKPRRRRIADA